MRIRVEPFTQGFLSGIKPQMTPQDRELFSLVFKAHQPLRLASKDEMNPSSPAHFFKLGASHLNVLLPVWILNGRRSVKTDRFRIACTDDHSFILDTKESIVYDPTIEMKYVLDEYVPFRLMADWREETMFLFRGEIRSKRLLICSFAERIEHIPALYAPFVAYVLKHRLKGQVQGLRFGLGFEGVREEVDLQALQSRALVELVMLELWQRSRDRAA